MKWKTVKDAEGNDCIVMEKGGNPVFIKADDTEAPFDADGNIGAIKKLSDQRDEEWLPAIKKAEEDLVPWKALATTPEDAQKALTTVKDLPEGKLVEASKLDEARKEGAAAQKEAFDKKEVEWKETEAKLSASIRSLTVGKLFNGDALKAVAKKTIYGEAGAVMMGNEFGRHFRQEGDDPNSDPVAYHDPGTWLKKVLDPDDPSKDAKPAAALAVLISAHPQAAHIWAGEHKTGTGGPTVEVLGGENETPDADTARYEKMSGDEYRDARNKDTADQNPLI